MALPSVIHRFILDVSDTDAAFYNTLELRVARHPSESDPFFVSRVIAAALHASEGAEMSRAGLCDPDDPPLIVRDLTGRITHWIDIGNPGTDRLHKASKKADSVFVYTYRRPELLIDAIRRANIHRKEALQLFAIPGDVLDQLAGSVSRVNEWSFVRTEGDIFVSAGDTHVNFALQRLTP